MAEGDAEGSGRYITRAEAEGIATMAAKAAANETVTRLFATLGVNIANFDATEEFRRELEFLRVLVHDGKELKADMDFLRSLRTTSKKLTGRFVWTIVTVLATGFAVAAVGWFKDKLHL